MIKVDNKATIQKLARSVYRKNRMRNTFSVIAIILTTVLFCALFTIAQSMKSSFEESTMRQVGGNAHGGFKYLSQEEYDTLSRHPLIKEISYSVVLANAENEELLKRPTEIRYMKDALEAEMMFCLPETGRLPEAENEFATDTIVLEKLGIPARLGEKATLEFSVGEDKYFKEFTLVGFWTGDVLSSASQMLFSKAYVDGILGKYSLDDLSSEAIGTINADVNFANSWNIERKLQQIILESGYRLDEIDYGVNWAFAGGNTFGAGVIFAVFGIALVIAFCGYLMIANVFLISIHSDIRFYGLLRTIGTTKSQIKKILRRQALLLAVIGIPVGVLLGLLVGDLLAPMLLGMLNTNVVKASFSPFIIVFSVLFSLVTLFVSIGKAAKLAAKVSPMEAVRANEGSSVKRETRKGNRVGLWKMAFSNVGRNKKRVVFVVLSLSLSLIILNGAFTLADSFDMEKYLSQMITHDFVMGDASWFNVYARYVDQDTVSPEFLRELGELPGIESAGAVYFTERSLVLDEHWKDYPKRFEETYKEKGSWLEYVKEQYETGIADCHVYGLDETMWQELELLEGSIDIEKLESGNYAVAGACDTEGLMSIYHVGDRVEISEWKEDKQAYEKKSYEIIAVANIPYATSIKHSHSVEQEVFLPSDIFLRDIEQKAPMITTLDVADAAQSEVEEFLKDYAEHRDKSMQYESRRTYAAEYENTKRTYRMVGLVACILLAFIGIANFTNTVLTSIVTRKRELALLQAVGMTVAQQRKMLVMEGVIYLFLTIGVVATAGNLMVGAGLGAMLGTDGYFTVRPTILPSLVCIPVFLLLTVVIPICGQQVMCRSTVVDRLREME